MPLPVRKSAHPRKNAPVWALSLLGLFGAVKVATDGNLWAAVAVFVGMLAYGVVTQVFTKPGDE